MGDTKSQYQKIINKSRKIFEDKNSDYGSSWRILRVISLVDRIHIKAQRIRNLQNNISNKIDEGQTSEFYGIINYSIMGLIQLEIGVVDEPNLKLDDIFELYDKKVSETFELMIGHILNLKMNGKHKNKFFPISYLLRKNFKNLFQYTLEKHLMIFLSCMTKKFLKLLS